MRRRIDGGSRFEREYGYSRAVVQNGFVFVAGTTGYDYATMTMPEEAGAQAEACWRTIAGVLDEAGSSLENVVRATYYLTDRADAEAVLTVCGRVLRGDPPGRDAGGGRRAAAAGDEGRDRGDGGDGRDDLDDLDAGPRPHSFAAQRAAPDSAASHQSVPVQSRTCTVATPFSTMMRL